MMERPILFSGPMVQAILELRKTMTRRIVKPQPTGITLDSPLDGKWLNKKFNGLLLPKIKDLPIHSPYGQIGDQLWVREAFGEVYDICEHPEMDSCPDERWHIEWKYRADREQPVIEHGYFTGWKPSIHMPREVSRIVLEITDIRIERLQDISEEDALAEGIISDHVIVGAHCAGGMHTEKWATRYFYDGGDEEGYECAVDAFAALWDSINGAGSWELNPWVRVVSFKVVEPQTRQATKYDWSNVPDWVQWLATDCLGVAGFAVKPSYSSFLQGWTSYGQGGSACLVLTAPDCAFEDSLEQRPVQGGEL